MVDVLNRVIDPRNAVVEDAAPLGDSPLFQIRVHGVGRDDRIGSDRNPATLLLADRSGVFLANLEEEAVGAQEHVAQNTP